MNRPYRAALAQVGMLQRLGHGQDRRDRHVILLQRCNRRIITRLGADPALDDRHQLVQMAQARRVVSKARVPRQSRLPHRFAQLRPMLLQGRDEDHVALAPLEHARWTRVPRMRPGARRVYRPLAQAVHLEAGFMVMRVGVEQREVEVLPAPGALAVQQCRTDRAHRMRACGDVTHGHHRKEGRPSFSPPIEVIPEYAAPTQSKPGSCASGPVCPKAEIEHITSRGLSLLTTS